MANYFASDLTFSHLKNRQLITDKTSALGGFPSPHFNQNFNISKNIFNCSQNFFNIIFNPKTAFTAFKRTFDPTCAV